jgi:hypothetical protein
VRELQLTFRQAAAFVRPMPRPGGCQPSGGAEPLTGRLRRYRGSPGQPLTFRRVDMQLEWLRTFRRRCAASGSMPDRRNLYSLRANDEARARGRVPEGVSRQLGTQGRHHHPSGGRPGRTPEVKRGQALVSGQVEGTTLNDRQGAARLLAEYFVSVGRRKGARRLRPALQVTRSRSGIA